MAFQFLKFHTYCHVKPFLNQSFTIRFLNEKRTDKRDKLPINLAYPFPGNQHFP